MTNSPSCQVTWSCLSKLRIQKQGKAARQYGNIKQEENSMIDQALTFILSFYEVKFSWLCWLQYPQASVSIIELKTSLAQQYAP